MFCSKCGSEIEEGELFCGNCGTPVSAKSITPEKEESQVPLRYIAILSPKPNSED